MIKNSSFTGKQRDWEIFKVEKENLKKIYPSLHQPSKMPKGKKAKGKKVALAHTVVKKQKAKKVVNPLFEKRPKNFSIVQNIQLKRALTHLFK